MSVKILQQALQSSRVSCPHHRFRVFNQIAAVCTCFLQVTNTLTNMLPRVNMLQVKSGLRLNRFLPRLNW